MQVQADIINALSIVLLFVETTAMGAAYLAGLLPVIESKEEIANNRSTDKIFLPSSVKNFGLAASKDGIKL